MIVFRGRMLLLQHLMEVRKRTSRLQEKGKRKLRTEKKMVRRRNRRNQRVNELGGGRPSTTRLSFTSAYHFRFIARNLGLIERLFDSHSIANLKVKNESEIDFSAIDDPTLQPQGTKNLRDRFKHLRDSAILDITERDQLGTDAKIPYQSEFSLSLSSTFIQH